MTKVEQFKLMLEGKMALNEMLDRQAKGDHQFDEQIKQLSKEWGELVRNFLEETT